MFLQNLDLCSCRDYFHHLTKSWFYLEKKPTGSAPSTPNMIDSTVLSRDAVLSFGLAGKGGFLAQEVVLLESLLNASTSARILSKKKKFPPNIFFSWTEILSCLKGKWGKVELGFLLLKSLIHPYTLLEQYTYQLMSPQST